MKVLVTGGAGFIGSAFVRHLIARTPHAVVNVDKLTYAACPDALADVADDPRYAFEHVDIGDARAVARVLEAHRPDAVVHLAAESHVDRSIDGPAAFIATNVVGTFTLLEQVLAHVRMLPGDARAAFRFHHVSTDEVFGSLASNAAATEQSPYAPSSPYAASKASADHLVSAFHRTYGLPVVLSYGSNTYGPWQFPEKLIPLSLVKALRGEPIAVYGDGAHTRDWLHVDDHARALACVLERGEVGQRYNIGGGTERTNLAVVHALCDALDATVPPASGRPSRELVTHVPDRPGHDRRYALDTTRIRDELGFEPEVPFEPGLRETVAWYVSHRAFWEPILASRYDGERLGAPADEDGAPP